MRLAFFEDAAVERLHPLTLARPAFELVVGHFSARERLLRQCVPRQWGALVRSYLVESYSEQQPACRVNDLDWLGQDTTVLVNGRWLPPPDWQPTTDTTAVARVDGTVVSITVAPDEVGGLRDNAPATWLDVLARRRHDVDPGGILLNRPWDLIEHNAEQIGRDFAMRADPGPGVSATAQTSSTGAEHPATLYAVVGAAEQVAIHPTARIDPYVVLDSRGGPVFVDAEAVVLPFTRLEGPCYVGRGSELFRAHVRSGTTIGPVCRVGGEVEASILHGYVNKYHDGFLGHSYLCPWVNVGAETTNSDLKSDYSEVVVPLGGEPVETGQPKVGVFVGDHTKTAVGCLFNTGSTVGVCCTLLPAGPLLPKHIPSFCNVWHGRLARGLEFERLVETARTAMSRRGCEFTAAQQRLLRTLFELTHEERGQAIRLFEEKHADAAVLGAAR